ncbi:MAG TPA: response regulator transcription factor [Oculatellaceae cyanobacterium]
MNIFFVEDNAVLSRWLQTHLSKTPELNIIGNAAEGRDAVEKILSLKPDIALVDIGLPDISGIQVTREIKQALPSLRVIMLTASDDQDDIFNALEAGADGYVLKAKGAPHLTSAIEDVRTGSVWLDPSIAQFVLVNNNRQLQKPTPGRHTLTNIEIAKLGEVAASNCKDGVCLVDPEFVQKLKRLHSANATCAQ